MLILKKISLVQFKNYQQASFDFDARIIAICGNNGIGKTNLLDAIYYLCFTKSYFSKSDQQHVLTGSSGFRIEGSFIVDGRDLDLLCILRETGKKEFFVNGEPYDKFSRHIGRFPCVMIAPDDIRIITGGSEERRRFLDALLCQLDARYLQSLLDYNKILSLRNGFLRSLAEKRIRDSNLLDVYDEQLLQPGTYVFQQRFDFLQEMVPLVKEFYTDIAGKAEPLELVYNSQLLQSGLAELLLQNRDRDLFLQRTSAGIHKDDLDILLGDQPFRAQASQGQRKSLLFALKWAEYTLLKKAKGFAPLLLLDDVFEKLDATRMYNLLRRVSAGNDGQIFITDTHPERIRQELKEIPASYQLITL